MAKNGHLYQSMQGPPSLYDESLMDQMAQVQAIALGQLEKSKTFDAAHRYTMAIRPR